MYTRALDISELLKRKSILLLGPRQTGKSTLTHTLPNVTYINCAESQTLRELSAYPERLRQRLNDRVEILVIDEAQLIPELFNEVQVLLDRNKELRVVLTGSSARKLRRKNINLLPGRVWRKELHPLVSAELGLPRISERASRGSLPGIIDSPYPNEELRQYVSTYLEEEIRQEGLTRNIGNFSRFLEIAALTNGEQLNYQNVANDVGLPNSTVKQYYEILQDTLIGILLEPFRKTKTRKAVATPKFYFFDWGVVNGLLNRFDVPETSDAFGRALEHIIFQELRAYISYYKQDMPLYYWRSHSRFEVDFMIGEQIGIEVKAKRLVHTNDFKGLLALSDDVKLKRKLIVCRETHRRKTEDKIEIFPVDDFLRDLWAGEIF